MIGKTLRHYEIVAKIGEGGMGVVYRATDTHLDRTVALKVLPQELMHNSERRRQFVHEAKTASSLNHANIVTIYDIDTDDGVDFIAMEYVAGQTLFRRIAHTGLPLQEVLRYGIQIADALAAAHAAGVIHKDLKPTNIVITDHGVVKLLDFGLATLVQPPDTPENVATQSIVTRSQLTVSGTAPYMSPEQAEGKKVDVRSDIFSFGTVLYEMVTGQKPFAGDSIVSTLFAVVRDEPRPSHELAKDIPWKLERVLTHCLRKSPQTRYQHMGDVKLDLIEVDSDLSSGRVMVAPGIEVSKRRRWPLIAAIIFAIIAGCAGWFFGRREVTPETLSIPVSRITYDSGLTTDPALSPDGKLLAYASDRAGNATTLNIWLQQVGSSQAVQLTSEGADDTQPAFSPDGTRIVFRSERDGGGIYSMPALGGEKRFLAKHGRNPEYSPDGNWIAYWVGEPHLLSLTNPDSAYVSYGPKILVMPANGGTARQLQESAVGPVWLPDSKHLLCLGNGDFEVLSLDGGPAVKTGAMDILNRAGLVSVGAGGMWAVDGSTLLLPVRSEDTVNLCRLHLSPATFRASGPPELLTLGTSLQLHPAIGANGRIAFVTEFFAAHIWSVPIDMNHAQAKGAMQRLTDGETVDRDPSLSADGKFMVFRRSSAGGFDVWLKNLRSGRQNLITSVPNIQSAAALSPDGSKIAYVSRENDRAALHVASAAGGDEILCESCAADSNNPCWMPDGRRLVYAEPESLIWALRDLNSGTAVDILKTDRYPIADARVSSDGKWIAFHTIISQTRRQLFTAPIRAGALSRQADWIPITDGTAMDREGVWSPDGNLLYFQSDRDGFRCIWAEHLDPATKRPKGQIFPVLHFHGNRRSLISLARTSPMSVTAGKMTLSLGETTGNIWMMDLSKRK